MLLTAFEHCFLQAFSYHEVLEKTSRPAQRLPPKRSPRGAAYGKPIRNEARGMWKNYPGERPQHKKQQEKGKGKLTSEKDKGKTSRRKGKRKRRGGKFRKRTNKEIFQIRSKQRPALLRRWILEDTDLSVPQTIVFTRRQQVEEILLNWTNF